MYKDEWQEEKNKTIRSEREFKSDEDIDKTFKREYSLMPKNERRRYDYYRNSRMISCVIANMTEEKNRLPTVLEIAAETNLSRTTIHKHLKGGLSDEMMKEDIEMIQKLRLSALESLFVIGVSKSNVKALTEFLKLTSVPGKINSSNINSSEKKDNYIQINNTYVTQEKILKLSPEQLRQIESILSINKVNEKVRR